MIVRAEAFFRRLARFFSRVEWTARLLNLPRIHGHATRPGLVMIQIDGLGITQMERAVRQGNMPFLARLMNREGYLKYRHYTGLPSNTPAVQGELFYGVGSCVPAFSFKDSRTGEISNMFNPDTAASVEKRLQEAGEGLLKGGSAYGNIFTGGAEEAHFCAASMGWGGVLKAANPFGIPLSILLHFPVFIRALVLIVIEFALALADGLRGILTGKNFIAELGFIPLRVAICVLLREIIAAGAKNDIARGLPVVQLNFAGYDEQAHHRGPKSAYAHWSLRGIDSALAGVWKAAHRAHSRDYDVFIYSDHGQEDTVSYREECGRPISEAVNEIFKAHAASEPWLMESSRATPYWRAHALKNRPRGPREVPPVPEEKEGAAPRVLVAALGNVGHIYPPQSLTPEEKETLAGALVLSARIPFVMTKDAPGRAVAWNANGKYLLPEEADKVIDADHPFFKETARDLAGLCHHPDAGELILFGWRKGVRSLTFHDEQGTHAGPGPEETSGFALLPPDALSRFFGETVRTEDLRQAAVRCIKRGEASVAEPATESVPAAPVSTLRVMTYNVHGCMGRDGKVSPERIARVIARHHPDIVALQELGATELSHQAEIIATTLAMAFHFHPSFLMKKGKYGNAILSRFPLKPLRVGPLPKMSGSRLLEPRGALWVEIDCGEKKIHFFNTHLSLSPAEGLLQTEALMGGDWMGNAACSGPVILCGDLNASPKSKICARIGGTLRNAQLEMDRKRPLRTLPSFFPVSSVDHVFVGPGIRVQKVEVPGTHLEKIASDHLPLIAELEWG